jgi:MYXO-CTERM domain-containing protein
MIRASTIVIAFLSSSVAAAQSYWNFEAGHVRPLAIEGTRLYAVNTPDDRLEIYDLSGGSLAHVASVAVGLSPVAVAVESSSRVWVVNHLSDSVSIVDVASDPPTVVRTLLVGDEPRDIVFAGPSRRRAFITTAHRGQNHPVPRGDYELEGIGRADVWVFDGDALGAPLGGTPLSIVQLFGDRPRALAVSPDGSRVYAAVFYSGNRTTALNDGLVCDGGPLAPPCSTGPGGLPAPFTSYDGSPAPETGLIVRFDPARSRWVDELDRDWSAAVRFELPDYDVFEIDATASPPAEVASYASVGTVNFNMVVNPVSGALYVSNTDAHNEVRFEGPGSYVRALGLRGDGPYSVQGHLHEARVTVIEDGEVAPHHLNPHLDYGARPGADDRDRSISTPLGMAVSADGSTLYVAGYGSSAIGVFDTGELANVDTSASRLIRLGEGPVGPTGLALDETRGRMYVMTRFDNSIATVDLETREVISTARMHTPEPASAITGRPMLYDARFTSTNGESSCGSCHVFGDLDGLAWDLGDPDGEVTENPNPLGPIGAAVPFHPMKGPMTTQSLFGLADQGPLHWRGDRTGGNAIPAGDPLDEMAAFGEFSGAFEGLLGREEGPLRPEEMQRFGEFVMGLVYPPNPIRQLDNVLRADEARGRTIYLEREAIDTVATCNGCHTLDASQGFFGSNGETTFENEPQQFKVAHLRNAYQKVGMFGMALVSFFNPIDNMPTGPQVRGFGYLHDGSTDTVFRFLHASVFNFNSNQERRDVEAYTMAFDTTLAPIVGQQVTLDASSDATVDARIDLMIARASAPWTLSGARTVRECDLVVRGVQGNELRGWLYSPTDNAFRSDRAASPLVLDADLRAIGRAGSLTYTCAPPGSGVRMALDRDEDGALDRDELDMAADPASRPIVEIPNPELPDRPDPPMLDGGMPDAGNMLDGGTTDAGMEMEDGGCGCRASGSNDLPGWPLALAAIVLWRRRR